jgi:tetratricopeptide (TPR) repeat protein
MPGRVLFATTLLLWAGVAGVACSSAPVRDDELPPDVQLEGLDDRALLERAGAAYEAGRHEEALAGHELLLEVFPDSPHAPVALYNAGLSLEALGRYEAAIERFRAFLDQADDRRPGDATDARFHVAACLESLRRYRPAAEEFAALLDEPLVPADRVEAGARAGWAFVRAGDLDRAEPLLGDALATFWAVEQLRALPGAGWAPLASFAQAEILRRRTAAVPLRMPHDQLARDLHEKAALFSDAEERYLATIRFGHRTWSIAAGCRLGRLYERLHRDLLQAQAPTELLSAEARGEYFAALRGNVVQLVEKARIAYERTLELGDRLGNADPDWMRRTLRGFERADARLRAEREARDGAAAPRP